jgi:hypothetical protein
VEGYKQDQWYLVSRTIASFRGQWFSVAEFMRASGLAKSTAYRQLNDFVEKELLVYEHGKYSNREAMLSLFVTVESIRKRLQEQGIEPTAEVLACAIAHMRQAAALAADDALDEFICDMIENSA